MEDNKANQHQQGNSISSNILFGTSSDGIEEGLHNGQFLEPEDGSAIPGVDDKNQIVNEQEQNEVVNATEESFNQGISPEATVNDTKPTSAEKELPKEEK